MMNPSFFFSSSSKMMSSASLNKSDKSSVSSKEKDVCAIGLRAIFCDDAIMKSFLIQIKRGKLHDDKVPKILLFCDVSILDNQSEIWTILHGRYL